MGLGRYHHRLPADIYNSGKALDRGTRVYNHEFREEAFEL